MSGLDKMIARILAEAQGTADEILAKANAEAGEIVRTAREMAAADTAAASAKADRGAKTAKERSASGMEMKRRQALLAARQEVIADVLEEAYQKVLDLDDESYFALLEQVLAKYVLGEDGEIRFSQKDLDRLPAEFVTKAQAAASSAGGSLALSNEAAAIDGGFLLVYGGIEENCSIQALFNAKKDELSDEINAALFQK